MMIRFGPQFEAVEDIGVRKAHAKDTMENPDAHEAILLIGGDKTINLYLKYISHRKPPIYLLVSAHETDGDTMITLAFPIPENLLEKGTTPSQALRVLTDNFGLAIRIGREVGRLIINKTIPLSGEPLNIPDFLEHSPHMVNDAWIKIASDESVAQVGLAYAIDLDRLALAI